MSRRWQSEYVDPETVTRLRTSAQTIAEQVRGEVVSASRDALARIVTNNLHTLEGVEGWRRAVFNPSRLLEVFPHLSLRAGRILASYQVTHGANGNSFTFAIDADRQLPEPPPHLRFGFTLDGPVPGRAVLTEPVLLPDWVSADITAAIEGDGSALSYFEASLFLRELLDLGACWHGLAWGRQRILADRSELPLDRWNWALPEPEEWRPKIQRSNTGVTVQFLVHSGLGMAMVRRHTDRFEEGYSFNSELTELATGWNGYVV